MYASNHFGGYIRAVTIDTRVPCPLFSRHVRLCNLYHKRSHRDTEILGEQHGGSDVR